MIYRVHLFDDADGSDGFQYFATRREAEHCRRTWRTDSPNTRSSDVMNSIDSAPTPHTRAEAIALLTRWASHEQNG